ncbi:MAG TPA: response regulator [Candidatus Sulfotelmatobacter sp.]|nr:response regulator [Candidatus Sulfotelmatobacter sp.]
MTTTLPPASLLSAPIPGEVRPLEVKLGEGKKKRVLLVDTSQAKRELRAEVMRKFGMDVDCAADIPEARSWWRAALYDLVLIDMEEGKGYRDDFCDDVRGATPPQRLAFLVGGPDYLAHAAKTDGESSVPMNNVAVQVAVVRAALSAENGSQQQRWGILEASRRISAVRSASLARTQAMRALPPLPRDPEGRPLKRIPTPATLDDLLREELR